MSNDVCESCGKPVVENPPPGSGWIHRSAQDALNCKPAMQNGHKKS